MAQTVSSKYKNVIVEDTGQPGNLPFSTHLSDKVKAKLQNKSSPVLCWSTTKTREKEQAAMHSKKVCRSRGTSLRGHSRLLNGKCLLQQQGLPQPRSGSARRDTGRTTGHCWTCRESSGTASQGKDAWAEPRLSLVQAKLLTSCSQNHYKAYKNSPDSAQGSDCCVPSPFPPAL